MQLDEAVESDPSGIRDLLAQPKFRVLAISAFGLLLLWFAPAAVWGAMPAWLVVVAVLYRRAKTDDWLALPFVGLPFVWATGLAQYATPIIVGISVLASMWADPMRGRIRESWKTLGAEKWLAIAAILVMLPSFFVVTGGGRMFTYVRTVGLTAAALIGMLVASAYARRHGVKDLVYALIAFAGVMGVWTACQLVIKGSIHLPLQRTASIMKLLPGKAGILAARQVAEAAGIKYEKIGPTRLVIRPNVFFVHAVATGAIAGLIAPLLWRRIRHTPLRVAAVSSVFSGLVASGIAASLARGAYIGIAGALIAALVAFWPRLKRIEARRAVPTVALALVTAAAVILPLFNNAKAREESTIGGTSYASRASYYRAALRAIPENLLFGHGTQRDNLAAPLIVRGAKVVTLPDGTQEARSTWSSTKLAACPPSRPCQLVFHKLKNGELDKIYYDDAGAVATTVVQSPDRDPPLGSHSTVLGVGYKYGVMGLAAFSLLWGFIGLAPLRRIRRAGGPLMGDARALWIGVVAFGLQLPIYEYDFDSFSPYIFYLVAGLLLGLSCRPARVELSREEALATAAAGTAG